MHGSARLRKWAAGRTLKTNPPFIAWSLKSLAGNLKNLARRLKTLAGSPKPLGLRRPGPANSGQLGLRFVTLISTVSNRSATSRRRNRRNALMGWSMVWPLLGLALAYLGMGWAIRAWNHSLLADGSSGVQTAAGAAAATPIAMQSQRPHALTWLEDEKRSIHLLIRHLDLAQSRVDVDWHIRDFDEPTQLKLYALTQIAQRGLKIQMRLDFADSIERHQEAQKRLWLSDLARAGIEIREPRFPRLRIQVRKFWTRAPDSSVTLHAPRWLQTQWNRLFQFQAGRSMQWIFDNKKWLISSRADSRSALFIEGEVVRGAVAGFTQAWVLASTARTPSHNPQPTSWTPEQRHSLQANWSRWVRHVRQPQLARALDDQRRLCKDMLMAIEPASTAEAKRLIPRLLFNQAQRTRTELRLEFPHLSLQEAGLDLFQGLTQRKTPSRVLMSPLDRATHPASVALGMSRLQHLSLTQTHVALQGRQSALPQHYLWSSDQQVLAYGNFNLRRQSSRAEPEMIVMCRQSSALVQDAQLQFEARWAQATTVLRAGVTENQPAWWSNASWEQKAFLIGIYPIAHWLDANL